MLDAYAFRAKTLFRNVVWGFRNAGASDFLALYARVTVSGGDVEDDRVVTTNLPARDRPGLGHNGGPPLSPTAVPPKLALANS